MAITLVKSNQFISTAGVQVTSSQKGQPKVHNCVVTTTGAAEIHSLLALTKVGVDSTLTSLIVASDDFGTTGKMDIGFYPGTDAFNAKFEAGAHVYGDAVDDDALVNDLDINTAAIARTERINHVQGIEKSAKKCWELAGLSARPAYDYFYLMVHFSEATTAAGDIQVIVTELP